MEYEKEDQLKGWPWTPPPCPQTHNRSQQVHNVLREATVSTHLNIWLIHQVLLAPVDSSVDALHLAEHRQQQGGLPTTHLAHDHGQLTWRQRGGRERGRRRCPSMNLSVSPAAVTHKPRPPETFLLKSQEEHAHTLSDTRALHNNQSCARRGSELPPTPRGTVEARRTSRTICWAGYSRSGSLSTFHSHSNSHRASFKTSLPLEVNISPSPLRVTNHKYSLFRSASIRVG